MPRRYDEYNETTDLYLEILRKAQAVEDQKLVDMIVQRLKHHPQYRFLTEGGCEIIPFPGRFAAPPEEDFILWPKNVVTHSMSIISIYCLILALYGLLT